MPLDPRGFQNVSFVVWKCEAVPMPELTFVSCRALTIPHDEVVDLFAFVLYQALIIPHDEVVDFFTFVLYQALITRHDEVVDFFTFVLYQALITPHDDDEVVDLFLLQVVLDGASDIPHHVSIML